LGSQLAGAAALCHGEGYGRLRGFWPLRAGEAKLVQIAVAEEYRGRGYAPMLIRAAAQHLAERGFHRLYARVWHNHRSSMRAFHKAGWEEIALVIVCRPMRLGHPWRMSIPRALARR
jgi:RimJ/RimL family protein N-acetyltransferase